MHLRTNLVMDLFFAARSPSSTSSLALMMPMLWRTMRTGRRYDAAAAAAAGLRRPPRLNHRPRPPARLMGE